MTIAIARVHSVHVMNADSAALMLMLIVEKMYKPVV